MDLVLDEGTHVPIRACILPGRNDASLAWLSLNVILLNQLEDSNHYIMTTSTDNGYANGPPWGLASIPHPELLHNASKNTHYLQDNTLYFSVSAEVANNKPWLECTTRHK